MTKVFFSFFFKWFGFETRTLLLKWPLFNFKNTYFMSSICRPHWHLEVFWENNDWFKAKKRNNNLNFEVIWNQTGPAACCSDNQYRETGTGVKESGLFRRWPPGKWGTYVSKPIFLISLQEEDFYKEKRTKTSAEVHYFSWGRGAQESAGLRECESGTFQVFCPQLGAVFKQELTDILKTPVDPHRLAPSSPFFPQTDFTKL